MKAKQILAVFDFDGTITFRDSFMDLLLWQFGMTKVVLAIIFIWPFMALYKLKIVSNDLPKIILFHIFFRGTDANRFRSICFDYVNFRLPKIVRAKAIDKIQWHQSQGHTVIIISASLFDWIHPWAIQRGIKCVYATNADNKLGKLTGRFTSRCLYGKEKVLCLFKSGFDIESSIIYAYGDSSGDHQLLEISTYPHYKPFRGGYCE